MIRNHSNTLTNCLHLSAEFPLQMLSDFERLASGERSILKADARVDQVVSAFQQKQRERWFLGMCAHGLSGSDITKQMAILRCTLRRTNSVVKSVEALKEQFDQDGTDLQPTGNKIIARLASILTGPDDKIRYRPGRRLQN